MTTLSHAGEHESTSLEIYSLVDTWLLLRNSESNGERNRLVFVTKSRGSAHSNQVREFVLSNEGPQLVDVYVGPDGVVTGSARRELMAREEADRKAHDVETERRRIALERRVSAVRAQIADLEAQLAAEQLELEHFSDDDDAGRGEGAAVRTSMARYRSGAAQQSHGGTS